MCATLLKRMAADFRTSLSVKIAVGGTTGSLQNNLDDDGVALPNGSYYFTLDGDSSQKEHIRATLTGSALSGIYSVSRQGVETSGVAREHRIGATVTITDFAHILMHNELLNGDAALDGSSPLYYDAHPTFSDDKQLVDKKYVDDIAIAGAPDASTTVKGIVEQSTTGEIDSGASTGGTGAKLFATPADLAAKIQAGGWLYAVEDGSGSDDTYTFSLTPAPAAYTAGMMLLVKLTVANTGACTGNLNSLGAKNIKKYVSGAKADTETGDIVANMSCLFYYDGTDLVLLNGSASDLPTSVISSVNSFFGTTKAQNNKVTFTAGENLATGDVVDITSADTVKRHSPTAFPSSYDQSTSVTTTIDQNSPGAVAITVDVSSSVKAAYFNSNNNGTDVPSLWRIPITASTGAIATMDVASLGTATNNENISALAIGSSRVLYTTCKANNFQARIADFTSDASTQGTAVTVDNSSVSEGFAVYISDSHVLFISRDTSNGNIQFAKYTASGTALSSSTTGTVSTAFTAKTFVLKGAYLFPGTTDILIVVQNSTDSTAQAFIASYNTGTSTFTTGSNTNFTSLSATSGIDAVFAGLSATQMFMACGTSTTDGSIYLVTKSGTSVTMSSATAMTTRGSTALYSLTALNSRCAIICTVSSTTGTHVLLELDTAGTNFTSRASGTQTDVASNFMMTAFKVNPLRVGLFYVHTSADPFAKTGTWVLTTTSVGLVFSGVSSATPVDVVVSGHAPTSALTAGSRYYADIGGLLTTDNAASPTKMGLAKDTDEFIVSVSGT